MGQGSSQLGPDGIHNEEAQNGESNQIAQSPPSPSTAIKKAKRKLQLENETPLKRKRKSSLIDNESGPSASTLDQTSQPMKRKRIVDTLNKSGDGEPNHQIKPKALESQESTLAPKTGMKDRVPKSESRASSVHPVKRALSTITNDERKPTASPALSAGEWQTKGRLKRTDGSTNVRGTTGAFKPEEVETLESFKVDFCNSNGCSTATFDLMVQHATSGAFPGEQWIKKKDFWKRAYTNLPDRDRRSIYRFMKRHFQASGQKPHAWTKEQEDELVALYRQHGPKWAAIAEMVGRSDDDVVQRWKNRLEHRSTMNTGAWSEEELNSLRKALTSIWSTMKAQGYDVGQDIYELDESLISWSRVSEDMKHRRSRQQCADKWRRIKLYHVRGSDPKSRSATPSSSARVKRASKEHQDFKNYKSATYVDSDDDSDEEDNVKSEHERTGNKHLSNPKKESLPTSDKKTSDESGSDESKSNIRIKAESKQSDSSSESSSGTSSGSESESESSSSTVKKESGSGSSSDSSSDDESDLSTQPAPKSGDKMQKPTKKSKKDTGEKNQATAKDKQSDKGKVKAMAETPRKTKPATSKSPTSIKVESTPSVKPTSGAEKSIKRKRLVSPSSSESSSESESDSGSSQSSESSPSTRLHKTSKNAESSEEGSDSTDESESESENRPTVSAGSTPVKPVVAETSKSTKRKRDKSPAHKAGTQDVKRTKVKNSSSPAPSETSSSESSESDSSSSESESEPEPPKSNVKTTSKTKIVPGNQKFQPKVSSQNSSSSSRSSTSSDSDTSSSSGSEDDLKGKKPKNKKSSESRVTKASKVQKQSEPSGKAPVKKRHSDGSDDSDASSASDSTDSSSPSSSDTDFDSDSD